MTEPEKSRPVDAETPPQPDRAQRDALSLLIIDSKLITRRCLAAAIQGADAAMSIMAVGSIAEAEPAIQDGIGFDAVLVSPANNASIDSLDRLLDPIRAVLPDTALILLARSGDLADIAAALRYGVRGYLTVETSLTITVDAIRLVCAGWTVHPPIRVDDSRAAEHDILPDPDAAGVLTVRQLQVARLLAKGMPNKSIAFDLHMSERTVKAHVRAIMQRFGAANRTQVVAKWVGSVGPSAGDRGGAATPADADPGRSRSAGAP